MATKTEEMELKHHIEQNAFYEICEEGVFSGSTQCNGAPVFFGMERINTEADVKNWEAYVRHALEVEQLYQYLAEAVKENKEISLEDVTQDGYSMQDLTGFSPKSEKDCKAFQDYLLSFKALAQNNEKALRIGTRISVGASAFSVIINIGSYVVYASKKKVSGKYLFPEKCDSMPPLFALQTYFNDLIMTVGSKDSGKYENTSFENRGIFRNPVTCFYDRDKFPGLSLKLHGFSACVRKSFAREEYMYVSAAYSMARILVNFDGWQKGDFILKGKDFLECTPAEKTLVCGWDTQCLIKIDALIRIFQGIPAMAQELTKTPETEVKAGEEIKGVVEQQQGASTIVGTLEAVLSNLALSTTLPLETALPL
ncbi:MAG TPA: hypothetical protein VGU44_03525, partial [Gammaproteobacteria bacterium]|nr:hypothetical protein [Gammaproteobacteria bacterium]